MLYSIVAQDVENSLEKRFAVRPDHIARLETLKTLGRLIMAGPNPALDTVNPGPAGFTGSIIIAEFDSLEDAQAWANEDPYFVTGVYESVSVKPFKHVLP